MSLKKVHSLEKACRVCMGVSENMISIFDKGSKIDQQIEFCTGVKLLTEHGMPTQICPKCIMHLSIAHQFKTTCLRSEDVYYKLLQKAANSPLEQSFKRTGHYSNYKEENKNEIIKIESKTDSKVKLELEMNSSDNGSRCGDEFYDEDSLDESLLDKTREDLKVYENYSSKLKQTEFKALKRKKQNKSDLTTKKVKGQVKRNKKAKPSSIGNEEDIVKQKNKSKVRNRESKGGPIICEVCGKEFKIKASYDCHLRAHRGIRNIHCAHCDYKCTSKSILLTHLRTHMNVKKKRFQCRYCPKQFNYSSNLHAHERGVHLRVRNYPCTVCPKAFISKGHLDRHLDTHCHTIRFTCEHCSATFTARESWKGHLLRQHDVVVPRKRGGRKELNYYTNKTTENVGV